MFGGTGGNLWLTGSKKEWLDQLYKREGHGSKKKKKKELFARGDNDEIR